MKFQFSSLQLLNTLRMLGEDRRGGKRQEMKTYQPFFTIGESAKKTKNNLKLNVMQLPDSKGCFLVLTHLMRLAYAAAKTQTSKKEKVGAQTGRALPVGLYLGQTTGEYAF